MFRLRNDAGRPMLMLACRHHVWEIILKHFWLAVAVDKTVGPDNILFKGLKNHWLQLDVENCDLTRFDWKSYRGTWLENQALDAKNQLRMIVKTGAFKNSKVTLIKNTYWITYIF